MISFVEFVLNITYITHLIPLKGTVFTTLLHSMINRLLIMPHVFLMNTSHNKNRILEDGWKNVLRNMIKCAKPTRSVNGRKTNENSKENKKWVVRKNDIGTLDAKDVSCIFLTNASRSSVANDCIPRVSPLQRNRINPEMHSKCIRHKVNEAPMLDIIELEKEEYSQTFYQTFSQLMLKDLEKEQESKSSLENVERNEAGKIRIENKPEQDRSYGSKVRNKIAKGKSIKKVTMSRTPVAQKRIQKHKSSSTCHIDKKARNESINKIMNEILMNQNK